MIEELFKKFSKEHEFITKEELYSMYGIVAEGIEQGKRDNGVWAKAFADARGDEQEAKAI